MSSGTPFVGIPLHAEQDLNVHLALQLGAGNIRPVGAVAGRVGADVERLLSDASYATSAATWADRYAAVDGPGLAAEQILALHQELEGRTPQTLAR